MTTPTDVLAATLSRDGSRPLLTWYDDRSGERVELSVTTTANWVAKTAGYLVDEHDVQPGDLVGVDLPLHWQTAVLLLASWAAGAVVTFDGRGAVTFTTDRPGGRHVPAGSPVVTLSLAAMGVDFSRLVAAQPDDFVALSPSGEDVLAAAPVDLPLGARVLTIDGFDDPAGLGYGLLAPLVAGGSAVLVGHPDAAALPQRCETERVTHTLGVTVGDLPRLG